MTFLSKTNSKLFTTEKAISYERKYVFFYRNTVKLIFTLKDSSMISYKYVFIVYAKHIVFFIFSRFNIGNRFFLTFKAQAVMYQIKCHLVVTLLLFQWLCITSKYLIFNAFTRFWIFLSALQMLLHWCRLCCWVKTLFAEWSFFWFLTIARSRKKVITTHHDDIKRISYHERRHSYMRLQGMYFV